MSIEITKQMTLTMRIETILRKICKFKGFIIKGIYDVYLVAGAESRMKRFHGEMEKRHDNLLPIFPCKLG